MCVWCGSVRQHSMSVIQANTISVILEADHMTQSHYSSLFIFSGTCTQINSTMSHIL